MVLRAGRRFGKSTILIALAADEAMRGRPIGYFCPLFETAAPVFDNLAAMLAPLVVSKNSRRRAEALDRRRDRYLEHRDGDDHRARSQVRVRSARRDRFAAKATWILWRASIAPTLVDLNGSAVIASTPWGTDPQNFFFQVCNDKTLGWIELHARSADNPHLGREALAEEKRRNNPLVWRQEFEAEFTSLDSAALIDVTKLLQPNGEPWPEPDLSKSCSSWLNSAIKTGASADGTAALFCAITGLARGDPRLWFLDYDIVQVTAGVLEPWFEGVLARARETVGGRTLSAGPIYVEDAATGPILLEKFPE